MSLLMKNPSLRSEVIFTPLLLQMNQCTLSRAEEEMLESRQGKVVILPRRDNTDIRHVVHRTGETDQTERLISVTPLGSFSSSIVIS